MHDQRTFFAFWIPGGAAIPAEEDDAVAEIGAFLRRQDGPELLFYLSGSLPWDRPNRPQMRMQWVSQTTLPGVP